MENVKIPVASPRKSRVEMDMSQIMKPEIRVEEHTDIVTEVAREILEENMTKNNDQELEPSKAVDVDETYTFYYKIG